MERPTPVPVIATNDAANSAQRFLNRNLAAESAQIAELASGSRVVKASDDASGLAIGSQLAATVAQFDQDQTNIGQGTSILQSTDGALAQISAVLIRLLALSSEAASGQVTESQRTLDISSEYGLLKNEIGAIISSTTYAGQALLSGSFLSNVKFLVGTNSTNFLQLSGSLFQVTVSGLFATGSLSTGALSPGQFDAETQAFNSAETAVNAYAATGSDENAGSPENARGTQRAAAALAALTGFSSQITGSFSFDASRLVNDIEHSEAISVVRADLAAITKEFSAAVGPGDPSSAQRSVSTLTTAINTITEARAHIGAYESEFNFSAADIATNLQNTTAATSVLLDADVAAVKARLSATNVTAQASIVALAQASRLPQDLLRLIQAT